MSCCLVVMVGVFSFVCRQMDSALALAGDVGPRLATLGIAALRKQPMIEDPLIIQAYRTLSALLTPGFYLSDEYFMLVVCVGVKLFLDVGPAPEGGSILGFWGMVMQIQGVVDLAYDIGEYAYDLVKDCDDVGAKGRVRRLLLLLRACHN